MARFLLLLLVGVCVVATAHANKGPLDNVNPEVEDDVASQMSGWDDTNDLSTMETQASEGLDESEMPNVEQDNDILNEAAEMSLLQQEQKATTQHIEFSSYQKAHLARLRSSCKHAKARYNKCRKIKSTLRAKACAVRRLRHKKKKCAKYRTYRAKLWHRFKKCKKAQSVYRRKYSSVHRARQKAACLKLSTKSLRARCLSRSDLLYKAALKNERKHCRNFIGGDVRKMQHKQDAYCGSLAVRAKKLVANKAAKLKRCAAYKKKKVAAACRKRVALAIKKAHMATRRCRADSKALADAWKHFTKVRAPHPAKLHVAYRNYIKKRSSCRITTKALRSAQIRARQQMQVCKKHRHAASLKACQKELQPRLFKVKALEQDEKKCKKTVTKSRLIYEREHARAKLARHAALATVLHRLAHLHKQHDRRSYWKRVNSLMGTIRKLRGSLRATRGTLKHTRGQLKKTRASLDATKKALNRCKTSLISEKNGRASDRRAADKVKNHRDKLKTYLTGCRKARRSLASKLSTCWSNKKKCHRRLGNARKRNNALATANKKLHGIVHGLKKSLRKTHGNLSKCRSAVSTCTKHVAARDKHIKEINKDRTSVKGQLAACTISKKDHAKKSSTCRKSLRVAHSALATCTGSKKSCSLHLTSCTSRLTAAEKKVAAASARAGRTAGAAHHLKTCQTHLALTRKSLATAKTHARERRSLKKALAMYKASSARHASTAKRCRKKLGKCRRRCKKRIKRKVKAAVRVAKISKKKKNVIRKLKKKIVFSKVQRIKKSIRRHKIAINKAQATLKKLKHKKVKKATKKVHKAHKKLHTAHKKLHKAHKTLAKKHKKLAKKHKAHKTLHKVHKKLVKKHKTLAKKHKKLSMKHLKKIKKHIKEHRKNPRITMKHYNGGALGDARAGK